MEPEKPAMGKPTVTSEIIGPRACFNGVGGSGRELMAKLEPSTAAVIAEVGLEKLIPAEVVMMREETRACFNGVGGSGRELKTEEQKA